MPRTGPNRELKWALEAHWAGKLTADVLSSTAVQLRRRSWETLVQAGIDLVPVNDFSLYDHVLDTAVMVGAVPPRFGRQDGPVDLGTYFAMARGGRGGDGTQQPPLELTKWFDTNYHYLVPELGPGTSFGPRTTKLLTELAEARAAGAGADKAVLLGPLSFLGLSRPDQRGFDPMDLLGPLVETYVEILAELARAGAAWVQLDEPALVGDRSRAELAALERAYRRLGESAPRPKVVVSTYFGAVGEAMGSLVGLPVEGLGLDFCAGRPNLGLLEAPGGARGKVLFAGVVDGRNVWAADLGEARRLLDRLSGLAAEVVVSTSCSLAHVPMKVQGDAGIAPWLAPWLAFAEEKLHELAALARGLDQGWAAVGDTMEANQAALVARRSDPRGADPAVRQRVAGLPVGGPRRAGSPGERRAAQQAALGLPLLPTTTIGSFPQTVELRAARAAWRSGRLGEEGYRERLRAEVDRVVGLQEELGLDVVVHGEPERDDMVRYFAGSLRGFALPEAGWVQSYGSRCVRPPVLYGDVSRPGPISAEWATYAASRTAKAVKGVLTGPVTMLRWSFVRDDQPLADTAVQLALAISDEVSDLEPLSDFKLVTACAELGATGATSDPTTAMRHTLRSLARRWLELHEEIKVHSVHLKALTRAAALQMIAAFGIGLDIAAQMLITAGDNDDRVRMRLPSPSCVGPARSPPVRARPTAGTDSTGAGIAKRTPRCIAP
jgi:5-methyltetrahydropteroyltriglutamate--homocysteine methyltransferase